MDRGHRGVFVTSPEIRTPMGGGLIAYRDRAAAERAADGRHGRVIRSVADLLSDSEEGNSDVRTCDPDRSRARRSRPDRPERAAAALDA